MTKANESRGCPFCAERVKAQAIVCKHCRREIGERKPTAKSVNGVVIDEGF